jgi:hypothetical protein
LLACQMPLRLGLPSDVRVGPDARRAMERVTVIAIPAPTAADTMTTTIIPRSRFLIRDLLVRFVYQGNAVMIIHAGLMSS